MSKNKACLLALLAFTMPLLALVPSGITEDSVIVYDDTTDSYSLEWQSRAGWTYFIQQSTDLMEFSYLPVIEPGTGQEISWGFSVTLPEPGDAFFLRLKMTDVPTSDPENDDFDGDGISNNDEFFYGTDPLSDDTDGDGIPDGWETDHGLDPLDPADATANADGDAFDNLTEYQAGLDPNDATNGATGSSTDPTAPGNFRVTDSTDLTSATLSWTDRSDDELMFQVERAVNGGNYEVVETLPANTTTWTDTGLDPANIYFYRVTSRNNAALP